MTRILTVTARENRTPPRAIYPLNADRVRDRKRVIASDTELQ
jgi:hypothetical protein